MNSWLHHHTVVVAVVTCGLVVIGMKVDDDHMPWLANHLDPNSHTLYQL